MESEKRLKELVGAYIRLFSGESGSVILDDLREYCKLDEPWGCALSHEEFSYRAGLQDMYKYIEALSSTK